MGLRLTQVWAAEGRASGFEGFVVQASKAPAASCLRHSLMMPWHPAQDIPSKIRLAVGRLLAHESGQRALSAGFGRTGCVGSCIVSDRWTQEDLGGPRMCADVDMMKTDFELFLPLLRSTTAADFAEVLGLLRMMYTSYGEVRQVCLSAMMFLYVSCTNSGRPPVLCQISASQQTHPDSWPVGCLGLVYIGIGLGSGISSLQVWGSVVI